MRVHIVPTHLVVDAVAPDDAHVAVERLEALGVLRRAELLAEQLEDLERGGRRVARVGPHDQRALARHDLLLELGAPQVGARLGEPPCVRVCDESSETRATGAGAHGRWSHDDRRTGGG